MTLGGLPQRATWVFAGDSITQGVFHTHGARSWVELIHERVRWELDRLMDIVINSGVSGWTAAEVNAEFDHLVGRFAPTVVSIALGTNDALDGEAGLASFRDELTDIARRSTALGARVVLHTPVPVMPDAPAARREWLPSYAEVVRAVAAAEGSTLIDHERHWLDHFGAAAPTAWMDDHTHPNAVGHREMANTTLRELGLGVLDERP
ncbi:SGNH/GDSL hydrolase family protein [Flexivirga sp. ID2601S]|uniref:SGNH/GDSL hydrolase family protein n=1 Tax=Flexivirga aerilata TaxID=1656889 RepID=A0A849AQS0_9MICO|nr:SGNH/GDSL hydrolase family protein [Flexivirga aerilata]NNG39122.1 SGNH/GDSL hydrolase family protein [Flexivirga aerilata]